MAEPTPRGWRSGRGPRLCSRAVPDPNAMTPDQLEAALGYRHNFARVVRAAPERTELAFDLDRERYPWLALPPLHPVVIDKIQYFAAVTGSLQASQMKPGTRSALTKLTWSALVPPGDARPAVRGVLAPWAGEERAGYELALFDDPGREVARVRGEGTAFGDRDFGAWRAAAKQKAADAARDRAAPTPPADPVAAGLGPGGVCLVSPPRGRSLAALVTAESGFGPAHPFHTGSGDHVNAAHLFDCAMQAAHLLWEPAGTALHCVAGEAGFLRFVELGVPFEIDVAEPEPGPEGTTRLCFTVRQAGRENTRLRFDLAPLDS